MSKVTKNISKTYLLPLLAEVIELDPRFNKHIVNTFIFNDEEEHQDRIYVLHDFSFKNPEFTAYEHAITNNQYFVDLIDIGNKVLYVFKFPDDYMEEYNHFKNGNYSKFGEDAKQTILKYFGTVYSGNLNAVNFLLKLKQILFKDVKLKKQIEKDLKAKLPKDAELSSIMDIGNETIRLQEEKDKITREG